MMTPHTSAIVLRNKKATTAGTPKCVSALGLVRTESQEQNNTPYLARWNDTMCFARDWPSSRYYTCIKPCAWMCCTRALVFTCESAWKGSRQTTASGPFSSHAPALIETSNHDDDSDKRTCNNLVSHNDTVEIYSTLESHGPREQMRNGTVVYQKAVVEHSQVTSQNLTIPFMGGF